MNEQPHGFLLVDKPAGMTSHDVIDVLRRVTGIRKIGHAGTLDPFATGLLIVAVSRQATKRISEYSKMSKVYEAEFVLGATSETLDPDSAVVKSDGVVELLSDEVREAMKKLTGDILQVPPMYSAIKIKGKKLYELARKGKVVKREPRPVTVHSFELLSDPHVHNGLATLSVRTNVSSGTYIRVLAQDLAAALGTVAYVKSLRRTSISKFKIENAQKLEDITSENWQSFLILSS